MENFDKQYEEKNFLRENPDMLDIIPSVEDNVDLNSKKIISKTENGVYFEKDLPTNDDGIYDFNFGEDDFVSLLTESPEDSSTIKNASKKEYIDGTKNELKISDVAISSLDTFNNSINDMTGIIFPFIKPYVNEEDVYSKWLNAEISETEQFAGDIVSLLGSGISSAPLTMKTFNYIKASKALDNFVDYLKLGKYSSNLVKNGIALEGSILSSSAQISAFMGPNTKLETLTEAFKEAGFHYDIFTRQPEDDDLHKLAKVYGNFITEENLGAGIIGTVKKLYKMSRSGNPFGSDVFEMKILDAKLKKQIDNVKSKKNELNNLSKEPEISEKEVISILQKFKDKFRKKSDKVKLELSDKIKTELLKVQKNSLSKKGQLEEIENYKIPKNPYKKIFNENNLFKESFTFEQYINSRILSDKRYIYERGRLSSALMKQGGLTDPNYIDSKAIVLGLENSFKGVKEHFSQKFQSAIDSGDQKQIGSLVILQKKKLEEIIDSKMKEGDASVIELMREKSDQIFKNEDLGFVLPRIEDIFEEEPDLNGIYKKARLDFDKIAKRIRSIKHKGDDRDFTPREVVDILRSFYNVSASLHAKSGSFRQAESILEKLDFLEDHIEDSGLLSKMFNRVSKGNFKNISNTYSDLTEKQKEKALRRMENPKVSDYAFEVIIPSLLSDIQTHAVNVSSNLVLIPLNLTEQALAIPIGKIRSSKPAQELKSFVNKHVDEVNGYMDTLKIGKEIIKHEKSSINAKQSLIEKLSQTKEITNDMSLGKILEISEDELRLFNLSISDEKGLKDLIHSDPKNYKKNLDEIKALLLKKSKMSKKEILKQFSKKIKLRKGQLARHRKKQKQNILDERYKKGNRSILNTTVNPTARQILEQIKAIPEGSIEGWGFAKEAFATGKIHTRFNKLDDINGRVLTSQHLADRFHLPMDENTKFGKSADWFFNWIVRGPGRVLMAEDDFFKGLRYKMELNRLYQADYEFNIAKGLTKEEAINKANLKMLDTPKYWHEQAQKVAQKGTFTEDLGPLGTKINKFRQQVPLFKAITLFYRTITNIAKQGILERTPLGLGTKEFRRNAIHNDFNGNLAIAKMTLGTSIASYVLYDTLNEDKDSIFVGRKSFDYKVENQINQYEVPMSFRIGKKHVSPENLELLLELSNDEDFPQYFEDGENVYIDFSKIEPFSSIAGIPMIIADAVNNIDDEELLDDVVADMAGNFFKFISERTWIDSALQISDLKTEPDRFITGLIHNYSNALIPLAGFRNFVKRNVDDHKLDMSPGNPEAGIIETEIDRNLATIQSNSPPVFSHLVEYMRILNSSVEGFNTDLPKRTDIWGNDVEYTRKGFRSWLPIYFQSKSENSVDREMVRLYHSIDKGSIKSKLKRKIGSVKLNPHQYYEYTKYVHKQAIIDGMDMKSYLDNMISEDLYNELDDEQKSKRISNIISKFSNYGKQLFLEDEKNFDLKQQYYGLEGEL